MTYTTPIKIASLAILFAAGCVAQSCPSPSGSIRPSVAQGYELKVVATGLSKPRGIAFDSQGHLLVVQAGSGDLTSHVITESNGCVTATDSTVVVSGLELNHGIQINGTTLFASDSDKAYSWNYNPAARTTSNQQVLISGMEGSDHSTRTLQLSRLVPGMMVVSRGSLSNLDINATTLEGGTAQVRAFSLANRTNTYTWNDGKLLAWGVRNEVGLAEHPTTGGIWGVENSADQVSRGGVDVSNNNPGEELNFFGYLNGTSYQDQGANFGYPYCLSVWNSSELPNNQNLKTGDQFAFDQASALNNENRTDQYCASTAGPRLAFQAHMAPLDIKFNNTGNDAWVTFHGSWNRKQPVGYRLSVVRFQNGQPVSNSDAIDAENIIVSNQDNSKCPANCFRPVAMAFDSRGRIFMSSDASGEIYMVSRNANSTATSTSSTPSGSASTSSATTVTSGVWPYWFGAICISVGSLLF